jgi:DEAD/DEAH box helicase domain-containing protein
VEILVQHLKCAAFEQPFKRGEPFGSLGAEETSDALSFLVRHRVLHESGATFHWAADAYPANSVSLRSVGWDNVVIIDIEDGAFAATPKRGQNPDGRILAEMDWRSAHTMLHEQAIYQHDGECWQVERFDYENHKAYVRKVDPDYYTDAMTYVQVSVIEDEATAEPFASNWSSGWGEVAIVEKVVGYKKIKFFTHENAGYGDVRLPEMQMHTMAFWLTVPEGWSGSAVETASPQRHDVHDVIDGLRGLGIALETVSTLALMCDPRDLGVTMGDTSFDEPSADEHASGNGSADRPAGIPRRARGGPQPGYSPTLFIYENTPGGIGLAERIFEQREELLARTLRLIERCPCESGCPACVGPGVRTRMSMALGVLRGLVPTA